MDARDFFETLFGNLDKDEEINIRAFSARSGRRGYHDFKATPACAVEFVESLPNNLEIYFGVNARVGRDGTKEGVRWVRAYHADVDYKWFGTRQDALDAVVGYELEPSLVVETGNGLHAYWLLDEAL